MDIHLKKDYMQYTGSFKERGARYTLLMLSDEQKKKGVIAASAGNHALALAFHGGQLNIPGTVCMPVVAPIMKVENCKKFGANVIIHGADIGEARERALAIGKEKDYMYINGFDHPNILAGAGTMGLEIIEQVPDVEAVVIPVGGGGLISGCAVALKTMKPSIKVIGVEPERCPSFAMALKAGTPVFTPTTPSIADGLTVPTVGCNAVATAAPLIDKMVTVSEEWVAISILRCIEMEGKKVVIPLCGGNIDTTILGRCLDRGLAADGRLVKFGVQISDRPGGIAELTTILFKLGVTIKDIQQERAWIKNDFFSVEDIVVVETRDSEHAQAMLEELKKHYNKLSFTSAMGNQDYDDSDDESEAITNGTNSLSLAVPNGERRRSSIKMKEITINN